MKPRDWKNAAPRFDLAELLAADRAGVRAILGEPKPDPCYESEDEFDVGPLTVVASYRRTGLRELLIIEKGRTAADLAAALGVEEGIHELAGGCWQVELWEVESAASVKLLDTDLPAPIDVGELLGKQRPDVERYLAGRFEKLLENNFLDRWDDLGVRPAFADDGVLRLLDVQVASQVQASAAELRAWLGLDAGEPRVNGFDYRCTIDRDLVRFERLYNAAADALLEAARLPEAVEAGIAEIAAVEAQHGRKLAELGATAPALRDEGRRNATRTLGGIADAMACGDLEGAAEIAEEAVEAAKERAEDLEQALAVAAKVPKGEA